MPLFTIETTYRLPIYRQRTYGAQSIEDACHDAVEDMDWSNQQEDHETSGQAYVTGIWPGRDTAYQTEPFPVPAQFDETVQRKSDHFETLLGILKMLAAPPTDPPFDLDFWRARAAAVIAKTEAILAGAPDPS